MRLKDEDKVNRIYTAVLKVTNREGFEGSCMSKIAAEANVSPATIYLYFENKNDMIKKLFIHLKSKMGDSYFHNDRDLSSSKGTFRTIWMNHYQYITDNTEEYDFLENFSNSPLIGKIDKENNNDYCPFLETLFEHAKKSGLIIQLPNEMIFSLLFAPIGHLVKKIKFTDKTLSNNELIQIFDASWKAISI